METNNTVGCESSEDASNIYESSVISISHMNLETTAEQRTTVATDAASTNHCENVSQMKFSSSSRDTFPEDSVVKTGNIFHSGDGDNVGESEDETRHLDDKDDKNLGARNSNEYVEDCANLDLTNQGGWMDVPLEMSGLDGNVYANADVCARPHHVTATDDASGDGSKEGGKCVDGDKLVDGMKQEASCKKDHGNSGSISDTTEKSYSAMGTGGQFLPEAAETIHITSESLSLGNTDDSVGGEVVESDIKSDEEAATKFESEIESDAKSEKGDNVSKESAVHAVADKDDDTVTDDSTVVSRSDFAATSTHASAQATEKPVKYKCLKCSRIMKDKRLIENHSCDNDADEEQVKITIVLDKDTGSLVCKECDYSSSGHVFEEHLMCHLMVRPYQCLYCKECFINRKEISRHVLKSHNGAKMSCALRALRKAKALIKEITTSGTVSFMAKVGGKVPLEKDRDKKKKAECPNSDQNIVGHPQSGQVSAGGDDKEIKQSNMCKISETSENQQNDEEFTQVCETVSPEVSKTDQKPDASKVKGTSDNEKSFGDLGLKIVASFSLQGIDSHDSETVKPASGDITQPNFIMTPPVEKGNQPAEILSFLGPERSVFEASDNSCSPMLPPPPLQPAPFHSLESTCQPHLMKQLQRDSNFFICSFNCQFSCLSSVEFLEHTASFHSTETYFPCYYCGHRSPNETDLVRHISNHNQTHNKSSPLYVCGIAGCRFGTNMMTDYINHIKASHSDIPEPLCYSCGDTFPDVSILQAHVEDNVIHIVNCPHCPSKATDRRTILNHISSAHPGKAKMVSVANHLICHDRKMNSYIQGTQIQEILPPALTPAPMFAASSSVIDQLLSRRDLTVETSGSSLSTPTTRKTPSPLPRMMSPSSRQKETSPESEKSPTSESSDFDPGRVKEEVDEDADVFEDSPSVSDSRGAYVLDENGVRRRIYIPMSERQAENYRCRHCTFIARDLRRMHCHERSHGMPPTKKERFKCMFCPQGFDSELKFRLHITCHPGLIKFLLYRCKKCEFDTNQKHTIIRHITCNRDRKHRGFGPVEDQFTVVSRSLESRVLECERCDYMTRHKIHMAIHYQRKHNILRDKGEFTIESIMPTDTPVSSRDVPYNATASSSAHSQLHSPDSSQDGLFDFTKPTTSAGSSRSKDKVIPDNPILSVTQIAERNEIFNRMVSQQASLQPTHVQENQMRKFKCPICKYLLPKAADLKNHVKRHSEIGQLTLVLFRCKYCSCMSTARELLYEHLAEKHPGKPIALVKKIVAIDTTEVDKSFAETSMEESLDQLEESLHKEILSNKNTGSLPSESGQDILLSSSYEQLFVVPEGEEDFATPLQCPKCSYSSSNKLKIIEHISTLHTEVKVIGSDEDVDKLARATSEGFKQAAKPSEPGQGVQEEVLIVPDDQVFSEPALCSRCDFMTTLRREMVAHLQQNHPEISVMGRNSYPVQVSAMGELSGLADESCVVGSGNLDAKIRCLYDNYGTEMKCLICGAERPKKFFIHVHILRHLNIYLWKCAFCAHRGLQKYKMVDHIKKIHPGRPLSVRYLRVNVEAKVAQFLSEIGVTKTRKTSSDNDGCAPFPSLMDEFGEQASLDGNRSRLKSPGPGSSVGCGSPHSLGSDDLDEKIGCLYDSIDGAYYKCKACPNQFQRKFAMHRHIIVSHLKVALLSCAYCGMESVERHWLVDHILACHKPAPINILPLDIDLQQTVCSFMTRMATKELGESADQDVDLSYRSDSSYIKNSLVSKSKKKLGSTKFGKPVNSPNFRSGKKGSSAASGKKASIVDPDVIMLGRNALDEKLSCLYQERPSGQLRCLVCRWEFPRKYPLHRHIMLRHLKMYLVGCPYCPFEGIEKYTVATHIKEEHKDKPISIKFTQPDVEARVRQFVNDLTNIGGQGQALIQKPKSKSQTLLVVPKMEKQDETEDENEGDKNDEDGMSTQRTPHSGLVVAMFGKKKPVDDVIVKTEIDDENVEEGSSLYNNEEEEEERENSDNDHNTYNDDDEESLDNSHMVSEFSPIKRHPISSYMPSFHRSPAGGKSKALDVTTKIKVLKAKEGTVVKFYCEKCKFTSLHRSNIVRHIYKIHEKYQTHTCSLCSYQTLSLMLLQKHKEKAHFGLDSKEDLFPEDLSPTKPILGPLSFQKKRQNLLSKKSESHASFSSSSSPSKSGGLGVKQFACAYCHYETRTQEDILQHTRDSHSQFVDASTKMKSPASIYKSEDQFSACWDGSKKAVKRRLHDDDDEMAAFKRKRRFIFEKGNELVQCGHCDTKETSMSRMQDHMAWDHPGLPFQAKHIPAWRFVCKSCAVKTMATSKMKYHLNRHINYRPYTCLTCGAFFPSPDQCRRHSRSQGHEEQYTYVRNLKKEARVEELLEGTRQLALKVQDEAAKNPDFDISQTDAFIAKFQESRTSLRRCAPSGTFKQSKKAKVTAQNTEDEVTGAEGELSKKQQYGKSPQTLGVEQDITIKCYNCDFTSSNVSSVSIHHKEAHPGKKFLWTELERGFTCDSTGEALVDCDSVPGASSDVGYTTRMTLGPGNNTMRFKCKTCDFSSCVIQAMKSHLKSHQPKGFICPYCSRSFSGKEKLMRHQYCLHKGQALWVIHLRRSGVVGATSVKKGKSTTSADDASTTKEEVTMESEELPEQDVDSAEKSPKRTSQSPTTFLCSQCSYTSESLNQFCLHLAQEHEEFKHKVHDSSDDSPLKCSYCPFQAENETELCTHIETHFSSQKFTCGYCSYSAHDRSVVQSHLASSHSSLDPKIVVGYGENTKGQDKKDLLLNLKPHVTVERIPESVLNQYGYPKPEHSGSTSEEEYSENDESVSGLCDENIENVSKNDMSDITGSWSTNNKPGVTEYRSSYDTNDVRIFDEGQDDDDHVDTGMADNERNKTEEKRNKDRRNQTVDGLTCYHKSGSETNMLSGESDVMGDDSSCAVDSEMDIMIIQFSGTMDDEEDSQQSEDRDTPRVQNTEEVQDGKVHLKQSDVQEGNSSVFCSKDSTLLAAQEKDDDDDDDDDDEEEENDSEDDMMTFDNNVMLSSPLPMISLGDGMSMSPVNIDSTIDSNNGDQVGSGKSVKADTETSSGMLLDL